MMPPDEVIVSEGRQRKGLGDDDKKASKAFEELKNSIKDRGTLIQPIRVYEHSKQLATGYRRLQAWKDLGMGDIPTLLVDEVDPLEQRAIELDENLKRFDLSWQERTAAIAEMDALRRIQNPEWTQKNTAEELGITQGKVSEANNLMMAMKLFPEIAKAKTKRQAESIAKSKGKKVIRQVEVATNPAVYEKITHKVVCAKAEDYITTMPDGSAGRLILTDGPFGINYDKRLAAEGVHEAYEDSPESYRERTAAMAPHLFRVLPQDGFLVWFLAHDHFSWTRQIFEDAGFSVDPVPLVWNRSEGRTYSVRPDRWFGKGYDIALHCIKGSPELVKRSRPGGNVFSYKPVAVKDKEHIVERPIELYAELIECMTVFGEKVTDFFGGSGAVAAAAASIRRDHFTVEVNPNHIPTIINKIFTNTPQQPVKLSDLVGAANGQT